MRRLRIIVCIFVLGLALAGCRQEPAGKSDLRPIVGTWVVRCPEAPFPMHMFVFHSDGTVQQSNPDAGDPNTSDSSAMGVWLADGDGVKGKVVEITADRTTRKFVSRGEISFSLKVNGDTFKGTASAVSYDSEGRQRGGPLPATLVGRRVLP